MGNASIQPLKTVVPDPHESGDDPIALARRLQVPIWIFDIDNSSIAYANAPACHLWQAETEEELTSRVMASDMSATVAKRLKQYQADFIESDATFNEMWTLYPNGEPKSVMVVYSGFVLPDGRMAMQCEVLGGTEDEPENLRSAEALLHTDVMITLFSKKGPTLYLNPAARNALVMPMKSFSDIFAFPADYADLMIELSVTGEHRLVAEILTVSGKRWFDLSAKSCLDAATGEPAILVTAIDVSELKVARDKARYLADRDQLTGCYNRAYLQNHLSVLSLRDIADDAAIIFFDVDRFKTINDRHGHEAGDTVLTQIAARARAVLREEDVVSRLGGDEFVILLENLKHPDAIDAEVARIKDAITQPIFHDVTRIEVSVSMGVAVFNPGTTDFAEVMRQADIALYTSKQSGRDCWTLFNEAMGDAAQERAVIEDELITALENQEFILHYQPRRNLKTGQVVSVEGLVRWQHPQKGLIPPNTFIPICEETGMIEELGRLVLEMGVAQAIAWQDSGRDIDVSLNVSPRQFNDDQLLTTLLDLSQTPGFPSGKVELEITESVLIGDHEEIAEKLKTITKMGYRVAIDDFGTGYSNLSYISRFPLNCLKIDQSFVKQLPESGPIISLILTLTRQFGATAVAEGVETEEQLEWLTAHDCEQVQGYLFSPPVSIDEFDDVMDRLRNDGFQPQA